VIEEDLHGKRIMIERAGGIEQTAVRNEQTHVVKRVGLAGKIIGQGSRIFRVRQEPSTQKGSVLAVIARLFFWLTGS